MMWGSVSNVFPMLFFGVVLYMQNIDSIAEGNVSVICMDKERQALIKFKHGLQDQRGRLSSWMEHEDCCQWKGIECSNKTGHVLGLDISAKEQENQLSGNISPSLLDLEHLEYLDLSYNYFQSKNIPDFFGSFTKLRYLNLSGASFAGVVPSSLGNLSNLHSLDLSQCYIPNLIVDDLSWLSHLSSLRHLVMSGLNLSHGVEAITKLPTLEELRLQSCNLNASFLSGHNFSSLKVLDLSWNFIGSTMPLWLNNITSSLVYLDLSNNDFRGPISHALREMTNLEYLSLSGNFHLDNEIPKAMGNLCKLQTLDLSLNNLTGEMFGFLRNSSKCLGNSLERLNLRNNQLSGNLPQDLGIRFPFLQELSLDNNQLTGTIPKSLGQLSELRLFIVSSNSLEGVISETHFLNLFKLQVLDISSNSLVLKTNSNWVPPFRLDTIGMASCKLGPQFPQWLQTQESYSVLDLSNAEISDTVPYWFWNLPSTSHYLNLSNNHLRVYGQMLDLSLYSSLLVLDLNSNHFEGPLPIFSFHLKWLDLSNNLFSGNVSISNEKWESFDLLYLDLSNNLLSGLLADCWMHFQHLQVLNLANNRLSGKIPDSMGLLISLKSLHLRNNSFTGDVPSSIQNCMQLGLIDLGENKLSGNISALVGENLTSLAVLSLRSNDFHGYIPAELCSLTQLQILDIAENNISGSIPPCISNLTSIAHIDTSKYNSITIPVLYGGYYEEHEWVLWKGVKYEYKNTLSLLRVIDLSSNNLYGQIPLEITNLLGLQSLNLSSNLLTGIIPMVMGRMEMVESLDLSRNKLVGVIPPSMSNLNSLSCLDLSNNDLSGRIPRGTQLQSFGPSSYTGNPKLCGPPLTQMCPDNGANLGSEAHNKKRLVFQRSTILHWYGDRVYCRFLGCMWNLLVQYFWRKSHFRFSLQNINSLLCTVL